MLEISWRSRIYSTTKILDQLAVSCCLCKLSASQNCLIRFERLLTTQLIGFGISGLVYDLLVRPTAMVWPSNLAVVTLFNTLHAEKDAASTVQRLRFFYLAFLGCFAWQFMPGLFAPTLTSMALLCMVNNTSPTLRGKLSGLFEALSSVFSFRKRLLWIWVAKCQLRLERRRRSWRSCNTLLGQLEVRAAIKLAFTQRFDSFFGGLAGMVYVVAPLLYVSNFWDYLSFPSAVDSHLYNSKMERFNVSAIIKPDLSLDEVAFEAQRPLLLNPIFALSYGVRSS
jgi:hypothetical protein